MKVHHGGRKCCQNVSRRLAEAQKSSPDATNYFQEPLNLGPRAFPSVFLLCKNAKLQFIIRSLQVASSITGYFQSYVKNYSHNSQLAVDSTAFHPTFASQKELPTFAIRNAHTPFDCSSFTIRNSSFLLIIRYSEPSDYLRPRTATLQCLRCSQGTVLFMTLTHRSQCSILLSADQKAQKAT